MEIIYPAVTREQHVVSWCANTSLFPLEWQIGIGLDVSKHILRSGTSRCEYNNNNKLLPLMYADELARLHSMAILRLCILFRLKATLPPLSSVIVSANKAQEQRI